MCLIKRGIEDYFEEAKEDIICYKVMIKNGDTYISPYQNKDYTYWVNHSEEFFVDEKKEVINTYLEEDIVTVKDGFIHFYINLRKDNVPFLNLMRFLESFCLFKCLIPKGSIVIYGDDGTICAKKFRFVKEIYI